MSNILTGNPIIVDTAGATALTNYIFTATKIRWVSGDAASDAVSVQDRHGAVKFAAEASGANYTESEHFDPPLIFDGLLVPTLGSGVVYIYVSSATPIKT